MDVVCWCCENFTLKHTRITRNEIVEIVDGTCALKNSFVFSENSVCEDFILRKGLYTTRTIPKHCKNYMTEK